MGHATRKSSERLRNRRGSSRVACAIAFGFDLCDRQFLPHGAAGRVETQRR